jgi:HSP20 family molecular chaperone IbpA
MEKYKIYHPLEMMERILSNTMTINESVDYRVKEADDSFLAEFMVPGFSQTDITVEVSDNILLVEGKKNDSNWTTDFSKKFRLPDSVDGKKVEAKLENGILKLRVPKRTESISKKIEILSKNTFYQESSILYGRAFLFLKNGKIDTGRLCGRELENACLLYSFKPDLQPAG